MYNDKFLIVLSGTVLDKFTQGRLLGIFKQYDTDRIFVRLKQTHNLAFVKCCKEVLEILGIEYSVYKKTSEISKRKQTSELNYRLIISADLVILMQKDNTLAEIAMKYNKNILVFKGRR